MPDSLRLLPAHHYRRERWRNDQGWTREIVRAPQDGEFLWRASIAEINQDTLFSTYPAHRRAQALLQGEALQLGFVDGRRHTLQPPHGRIEFDGLDVVACHLPQGPVQVFNLIWRKGLIDARLLHRPLVGPMVFLHEPGVRWLVHLMSGHARVRTAETMSLESGDSLLLQPRAGERLVLEGGGEALLARLSDIQTHADAPSPTLAPRAPSPSEPPEPDTNS